MCFIKRTLTTLKDFSPPTKECTNIKLSLRSLGWGKIESISISNDEMLVLTKNNRDEQAILIFDSCDGTLKRKVEVE